MAPRRPPQTVPRLIVFDALLLGRKPYVKSAPNDADVAAAVMHDLNLSLRYCDRFLMVKDGLVAANGGVEAITLGNIENVYGLKAEIIEHRGRRVVAPAE